MRIAYSALMTLLLASAVSSVGVAQVLTPFSPVSREHQSFDHIVPVATVNLVGDIVALADPLVVQDASGEPFVLGAASLDLGDPSHAKIGFTITNASSEPIPWNTVEFSVERATPVPLEDQIRGAPDLFFCPLSRRGLAGSPKEMWQPGATVTVQVPIGGDCLKRGEAADPLGFLVYAGRELPHPELLAGPSDPGWSAVARRRYALLRRAIEKLTSQTRQQGISPSRDGN